MHDDMTARVIQQGAESEEFSISYGLKQGCVLAPTLFSLCLAALPMKPHQTTQVWM